MGQLYLKRKSVLFWCIRDKLKDNPLFETELIGIINKYIPSGELCVPKLCGQYTIVILEYLKRFGSFKYIQNFKSSDYFLLLNSFKYDNDLSFERYFQKLDYITENSDENPDGTDEYNFILFHSDTAAFIKALEDFKSETDLKIKRINLVFISEYVRERLGLCYFMYT